MTKAKIKLGLIGARGRLGNAIQKAIDPKRFEVAALIHRETAKEFEAHAAKCDVFLDVSLPAATEQFLGVLTQKKISLPYVVGCTGWNDAQFQTIINYSHKAPVIYAPNFSPGVNLLLGVIEQVGPLFSEWGYDAAILETHHNRKLDAPSGTAKAIAERLSSMKVQINSVRAGNIVGTHEVRFIGPHEVVSFTHEALDRSTFAQGALMAAEWLFKKQSAGLYSMKDVIYCP